MAKISAFIIIKNETHHLKKAIISIKDIADEIIVIDSTNNKNNAEIAQSLGAKFIINKWPDYVKQKAFGEGRCQNDWILNIDADEELNQELQQNIAFIFESKLQDRYLAYRINLIILRNSDLKPRLFAPRSNPIRLYNKKYASFANNKDAMEDNIVKFNEDRNVAGKIYNLNGVAYQRFASSIEQLVAKANFYSSEQAKGLVNKGRKPSRLRVGSEFLFWVFKAFFIRRYFVFGFDGFVNSMIFAFARFARLAKAREMQQKNNQNI